MSISLRTSLLAAFSMFFLAAVAAANTATLTSLEVSPPDISLFTARARQVFEKSAEQAGYFEHGKTRLVMPAVAAREEAMPAPAADEEKSEREKKKN